MSTQEFTITPVSVRQIVADLTYINYSHNRQLAPEVTPEDWKKVYGEAVERMEADYQAELRKASPEPTCDYEDYCYPAPDFAQRCGASTVDCPVCHVPSNLCGAHLVECEKCGQRMCVECAETSGSPCRGCQIRYSVASELDADRWDAELRQAVRP